MGVMNRGDKNSCSLDAASPGVPVPGFHSQRLLLLP